MQSRPFPIDCITTHLETVISRDELDAVGTAAQYASIKDINGFRPKTAFVLLARERWDGEPVKAGRQRMIVNFGVVIAVQNFRDAHKGEETMEEMDPLISSIRSALIGFLPPELAGARECGLIEGGVLDCDANTLLWMDVYQTQHFIGGGT